MMAKSRPPKDKPWYHVQITGGYGVPQTYVAEQNLELNNAANN
jgi:hemimethylated DNA binding protein